MKFDFYRTAALKNTSEYQISISSDAQQGQAEQGLSHWNCLLN